MQLLITDLTQPLLLYSDASELCLKARLKTLKDYIQGPDDSLQFYVCVFNKFVSEVLLLVWRRF